VVASHLTIHHEDNLPGKDILGVQQTGRMIIGRVALASPLHYLEEMVEINIEQVTTSTLNAILTQK